MGMQTLLVLSGSTTFEEAKRNYEAKNMEATPNYFVGKLGDLLPLLQDMKSF